MGSLVPTNGTEPAPPEITEEQRSAFLDLIREHRMMGHVTALRQVGVTGTKRDLKALLDAELHEETRLARGWNLIEVEQTTWDVAKDPAHPAWDRANARVLRAYHPNYQDRAVVEHEHTGGVTVAHEERLTLEHVVAFAQRAVEGLGGRARGELPAASDVLSEPEND